MNDSDTVSAAREQLIGLLTDNLVALRAKASLKQSELAEYVGIGRQTLFAIENRKGKMRWDTFLAICLIFSNNPETKSYMKFLGIDVDSMQANIISKGGLSLNRPAQNAEARK